ncbi:diadenylate cyclase [Dysgonomonas sp. PFB1-18]|uniref:diadenylate cyclase CdaA n=1 Tax=unclassified Dysgonomonas TaxID=2630389 RepID=UPI00247609C1|nr:MULTISPECIES: diadenylate cyclase CdaA [unclassified Dysgonomonas]MDH6309902.1 diadenylate cyclase [Dysgonomonas sp. PF1-14]MDH6339446.1 diadenylate cyclase [Dysgonomonas sp. PF1-16]MDH6380946.1 diadenylate cyclase [Dysgonomonas sp. PFB1-18]MDH6397955.1 diadenylate cyclase [Dysgonomonas sp. PF1-23]
MLENFGIKDIIDILLVATVMYQLYRIVSKSGTGVIFNGVLAFIVIWILVSQVLQMRLMGAILDKFVNIGLFVIIIIFQDEIRRFLISLGSNRTFRFFTRLFRSKDSGELNDSVVTSLVLACMNLAKTYTGALIVIEQEIRLGNYEETGEILEADISTRLIENIFFKNTPLHDGAMIIAGNKIKAAGCILPVSQNQDIPKAFGLRHRAALGISQETDAKVIVISEERGKISFASEGKIEANITPEKLQELLIGTMRKKKKGKAKS